MEIENQGITTLGKSKPVPSVQELVKESLEKVPNRYIQLNQEPPFLEGKDDFNDSNDLQVPIINMDTLLNGDDLELEKLHSACQEWGFFQVVNHGVDKSMVEKLKMDTEVFFNQPLEEKKKYSQTANDVEGYGQAFVGSEEQKLDWADIFMFTTRPKHLRRPHLLPMLPHSYRDTIENYSIELKDLATKLLNCLAKALKIDPKVLRGAFGDEGLQSLRMNYYPPCPQPDKVIGLTPHSDAVTLTILLQFNEIVGLQIRRDDKWVSVNPLPHAFVVNVGDILEIATNGMYRSILHRAIVNATKERISIAAFHMPPIDAEIGPIPELITPGTRARFRRINVTDYYKGYFSRSLDEKSYLDAMRINENDNI
ncbi:Protein SRG1 [Bienertia sinuspersici]